MTKDELQEILTKVWMMDWSADDAFDAIWAEPFENETVYKEH